MDIKLKSALILFQVYSVFCFSQQTIKTEYFHDNISDLNLSLYGQVKYVKEIRENLLYDNKKEREYFFNQRGQPTKIIESGLGLDVLNRTKRKEITVYEFENGKLISKLNSNIEGLDGNINEYDEQGNLINKKYYLRNAIVSEEYFEYDKQNRLLKYSFYVYGYNQLNNEEIPNNKDEYISTIKTFKYDEKGNLIEETLDNISGDVFKKYIYKYDRNGNKIEEGSCLNYKGVDVIAECDYDPSEGWKYDDKNQIIKEFQIGEWMMSNNTDTFYQYDMNGRKIDTKGYFIKIDTVLVYHFKYEYDDFGNQIKEEQVVGNYRFSDFGFYNREEKKYDKFQNLLLQEYITATNERIKVVKYNYLYDEKGNWIEQIEFEGKTSEDMIENQIITRKINYYD
jgi:hypothetical protein